MLKIKLDEVDMIPMLILEGELVSESVSAFKTKVMEMADKGEAIVLDMSAVKFIDSAGLGAIMEMTQYFHDTDTPIRMFKVSTFVRRVLGYFMKKDNVKLAERCIEFSRNVEPQAAGSVE